MHLFSLRLKTYNNVHCILEKSPQNSIHNFDNCNHIFIILAQTILILNLTELLENSLQILVQ